MADASGGRAEESGAPVACVGSAGASATVSARQNTHSPHIHTYYLASRPPSTHTSPRTTAEVVEVEVRLPFRACLQLMQLLRLVNVRQHRLKHDLGISRWITQLLVIMELAHVLQHMLVTVNPDTLLAATIRAWYTEEEPTT